jgi:hypothetical protein
VICGNPLNLVTHHDFSALDHFGERSSAPALAHRLLEPGQRLVHALARARLAMNEQARRTDTKRLSSGVNEVE